jgi:hypothetical protein
MLVKQAESRFLVGCTHTVLYVDPLHIIASVVGERKASAPVMTSCSVLQLPFYVLVTAK